MNAAIESENFDLCILCFDSFVDMDLKLWQPSMTGIFVSFFFLKKKIFDI